MKKIITLLALAFCLNGRGQGEYIIEINRTDGSFINTGPPIKGISLILPNIRAYKENAGIFIFPSAVDTLYSIDVSNDSIINKPLNGNFVNELEYSNSLNKLYGLLRDFTNNVKYVATLDPMLGTSAAISSSIPTSNTNQGISTFNQINNQYIFLDPAGILYTIDVLTGNIISSPSVSLTSNQQLINICFNDSTNSLYGIIQDNTANLIYLASINQTTGTVAYIGSGVAVGINNSSSAIDLANKQYLYLSYNGSSYNITTFDITSGNVVYNNVMSALVSGTNAFSLKYDNIRAKLFSIHWGPPPCGDCAGIEQYINTNEQVNIYPNPTKDVLNVACEMVNEKATLTITDMLGNVVKQMPFNTQHITFSITDLNEGVYNISLQSTEGVVNKRLIIVK